MREGIIELARSEQPVRLGARTYDVKPQVEVEGEVLYPELALVRFAQRAGWDAEGAALSFPVSWRSF